MPLVFADRLLHKAQDPSGFLMEVVPQLQDNVKAFQVLTMELLQAQVVELATPVAPTEELQMKHLPAMMTASGGQPQVELESQVKVGAHLQAVELAVELAELEMLLQDLQTPLILMLYSAEQMHSCVEVLHLKPDPHVQVWLLVRSTPPTREWVQREQALREVMKIEVALQPQVKFLTSKTRESRQRH